MLLLFLPGAGSALLKAYIHGHYRLNRKTGQRVWIESHTDKRPERHRASFEGPVHRVTHFQHHMALGRQREALHAFHDLNHEDAHKLAQHLGLAGDDKGTDKKALMESIHGKLATKRRELQASMGKEAATKEREGRKAGRSDDETVEALRARVDRAKQAARAEPVEWVQRGNEWVVRIDGGNFGAVFRARRPGSNVWGYRANTVNKHFGSLDEAKAAEAENAR
ncbi:MAG: hypothetical protein RL456_3602, partial [Pseudomonadota bacterium]